MDSINGFVSIFCPKQRLKHYPEKEVNEYVRCDVGNDLCSNISIDSDDSLKVVVRRNAKRRLVRVYRARRPECLYFRVVDPERMTRKEKIQLH